MTWQRAILFGTVALLMAATASLTIARDQGRAEDWRHNNLDAVFVFTDPAECRTGEPLTRIVRELWDHESPRLKAGRPISVPGFREPLEPRLRHRSVAMPATHGRVVYSELDIRGRWHGLRVLSLRASPSTGGLEIQFAEPADRVREMLRGVGFPLPAVGEWGHANYAGSGLPPMLSLQRERGGAFLYCSEPYD